MVRTLLRDPLVRIAIGVWLLASALYVIPGVPAAWVDAFSDNMIDLPFLPIAMVACWWGLGQIDSAPERRFWRLWGASFVILLVMGVLFVALYQQWDALNLGFYADFVYLAVFLCQVLAIEVRPHDPRIGSFMDRQRRLRSIGLIVLAFFWLAYFVLVPAEFSPAVYRSDVPSFYLYIALDVVVFGRLLWMRRETWSRRWAAIYGWLAAAVGLTLTADVVELFYRAKGQVVPAATALDLLWTTPLVIFVIGIRARHVPFPIEPGPQSDTTIARRPLRAGYVLLLSALSLPVIDYVLGVAGLLDPSTEPIRDVIAIASLIVLSGFTLIAHRILERERALMEATERRLTNELGVANKMDAVSRLAASVAHDFNNLIQVIQGRVGLIADKLDATHAAHDDLREVHEAAAKASQLASELLAFGREQPTHPVVVNLNDAVRQGAELLKPLLDVRTRIDVRLDATACAVRIDPRQFERMILNLGINARDAMPEGGTLTLQTFNPPAGEFDGRPTLDPTRVVLRVADTGVGMAPETIEHVFEPFFTTKGGRGSGLGLAIVHSLIQQSGGSITAESTFGLGTTFTIALPVVT